MTGEYKFGPGPVNTNWGSEPVNTNLGPGLVNKKLWARARVGYQANGWGSVGTIQ